jgi:predicted methyltransferase
MDMVLTFRNVHNWSAQKPMRWCSRHFLIALKPGGILGVVEHRAHPGTPLAQQVKSGYMNPKRM